MGAAPDGSINAVAMSKCDNIGPHNMFWQFSSGGALEHPGTIKYGWNVVGGAQPAGTGTYQININAFDSSGGVTAMVVNAHIVSPAAVLGALYVESTIVSGTNIVFFVRTDAGTLTDLGVGEQLHFTVIGRRLKQTGAVTFGSFQDINYNMGLSGL